ncbi:hypothetical protein D0817_12885 [Flavobacterium cupreum]|uniref:Uncharacterized protein n=1 Tax=Flavobacterium cupreum TaxID=2133766 RepID=A0A434A6W7_9FLAO|nr:hypothetical protein [Flavobacterium cupreum]RUT70072.1 hypothetical protein D0817_12885 [Flavobacterium cupreum]
MPQFVLENNQVKLSVRKSPFIIRLVLYFFAFAFFTFPTAGTIASIALGEGLHFGFIIGIGIFSLLGFYLLRVALWNTYGEEIIAFSKNEIVYEANYGWSRDAKKIIKNESLTYFASPIGYEEDNEGILILDNGKEIIECAVKMPQQQIEEVIMLCKNNKF